MPKMWEICSRDLFLLSRKSFLVFRKIFKVFKKIFKSFRDFFMCSIKIFPDRYFPSEDVEKVFEKTSKSNREDLKTCLVNHLDRPRLVVCPKIDLCPWSRLRRTELRSFPISVCTVQSLSKISPELPENQLSS